MSTLYEWVSVGVANGVRYETGKEGKIIGIAFPKPDVEGDIDVENDDHFDDYFLTIAAAKALVLDLNEAIASATTTEDKE